MVAQDGTESGQVALFSTENLRAITSFDDAMEAARLAGLKPTSSADLGDGFAFAEKETLIGVRMLCLSLYIGSNDTGRFILANCVTEDGRKVKVHDSGTGLCVQLLTYSVDNGGGDSGQVGTFPLEWKHGLRVSRYDAHPNAEGKMVPAGETFYLDTSA